MTDDDEFTVDAARRAAERDELGDWVAEFLASPGSDNAALAARAHPTRPAAGSARCRLPLDQLHRLAGPPGAPGARAPVDEDEWRDDVEDLAEQGRGRAGSRRR